MSNISIERLEDLAKGQCFLAEGAYAEAQEMARELLEYRKAGKEPVAWIVHTRGGDQLTMDGDYVANAEGMGGISSTPLYAEPKLQPVSEPYKLPDGWIAVPDDSTDDGG